MTVVSPGASPKVASEGAGSPQLASLEASAAAAGPCVRLVVVTPPLRDTYEAATAWGGGGWSNDWKPRLLLGWLRRCPRRQLVLFVDGCVSLGHENTKILDVFADTEGL